jgi:hypothetical protein
VLVVPLGQSGRVPGEVADVQGYLAENLPDQVGEHRVEQIVLAAEVMVDLRLV